MKAIERNFLSIDFGIKNRIFTPRKEVLSGKEKIQGVFKVVEIGDLIDFERRINDDKKPYVREIINGLKTEDKDQNILGFFTPGNSLIGMAYFLNDDDRSIYLSRLMTDPKFQSKGVASAILEELKMRYDTIRTVPIPLGKDYDKKGYLKRLEKFYTKRGFKEGRQWKRYRN